MAEEEPNKAKQAHCSVSSEIESACGCGCDAVDEAVDMMPDEELLYDLADLFKLFGDTTRMRILFSLFESEMCVCAIAELLGMTQSAISHQLKVLKQSNLIACRREGKTIYYFLADDHVRTIIGQGFNHLTEERKMKNEKNI